MALRKFALRFPEAYEDFPWGERAFKVRKKVFLFLGGGKQSLGLSVKLPSSGPAALMMPFAEPTHYGLGKSGWVTAHFEQGMPLPMDLLFDWIDESYRAIAPRSIVKSLVSPGRVNASAPEPPTKTRRPTKVLPLSSRSSDRTPSKSAKTRSRGGSTRRVR